MQLLAMLGSYNSFWWPPHMLTLTSQARTYTEWSAAVANTTTHPQRVEAFNQHSAKSSELVCNMINRTIHVLLFCEERLREIVRLCVCVCVPTGKAVSHNLWVQSSTWLLSAANTNIFSVVSIRKDLVSLGHPSISTSVTRMQSARRMTWESCHSFCESSNPSNAAESHWGLPSCGPAACAGFYRSFPYFHRLCTRRTPVWRWNRSFLCRGRTTPSSTSTPKNRNTQLREQTSGPDTKMSVTISTSIKPFFTFI